VCLIQSTPAHPEHLELSDVVTLSFVGDRSRNDGSNSRKRSNNVLLRRSASCKRRFVLLRRRRNARRKRPIVLLKSRRLLKTRSAVDVKRSSLLPRQEPRRRRNARRTRPIVLLKSRRLLKRRSAVDVKRNFVGIVKKQLVLVIRYIHSLDTIHARCTISLHADDCLFGHCVDTG
jgi:hypothetical protein